jgi:hypothetical protein
MSKPIGKEDKAQTVTEKSKDAEHVERKRKRR